MISPRHIAFVLGALALPGLAIAQLGLGTPLGTPLRDGASGVVGSVTGLLPLDRLDALAPIEAAHALLEARTRRLADFVRSNRDTIALDDHGDPAVRAVLLVSGASADALAAIRGAGYSVEGDSIEGLDLSFARITLSPDARLADTIKRIRKLAPGADVSADTLHFASGTAPILVGAVLAGTTSIDTPAIGLIDSGVAAHPSLTGAIEQRGFARGAPIAGGHGTAVASLIAGNGTIKGAAPGAALRVADVYGRDPAGGGALAIARALGWMAVGHVPVVTISLVGPRNPLLESAVKQAQARGMLLVAAVGNDGPAAPPAFPASYAGVIAVTGVDRRDKALIEAGRAAHLDFAAPGADMGAANAAGGIMRVRGTSFAAPLVAGRLYQLRRGNDPAHALATLAAQARDLGAKGPDKQYGRGIVCDTCRNPF
ncbi:hypothetical protein BH10PSE12_BH10PSE12_12740 [soil metagenome]